MERKIDLNHVLFLGTYLICMADALLIGLSTFGQLYHASTISLIMRAAAAGIIFLKLLVDSDYTVSSLLYIAVAGVVLLITYLRSGYNHVFYLLLFVLGIRNIDIRRVIRADMYMRIVLMLLILFCGTTGIIDNYITYRAGSSELRYSMGFNHPNTLASLVLILILEDAWLSRRKFSAIYMLLIWAIGGVVLIITLNRTAVLLIFLFPLLLFCSERDAANPLAPWKNRFVQSAFILAAVVSIMAMFLSERWGLFNLIDRLMSQRYINAANVYRKYGIPFLGQKVTLVSVKDARALGVSMAILDVSYLRMLIQAGPVVLMFMAAMYMRAAWRAIQLNDRITILILCIFVLFGLSESGANNVYMNFSLLIMAKVMYSADEYDMEYELLTRTV